MLHRNSIAGLALAGALLMTMAGAQAFDETKYPDWSGQWRKPQGIEIGRASCRERVCELV